jgi:hypothetical protein
MDLLRIIINFLNTIKVLLTYLIIIQQTMEWISMTYIITTQRHRRVEQIYFDQNNENIHNGYSPGQMNYRKREICMKRVYMVTVWIIMLFLLFVYEIDRL